MCETLARARIIIFNLTNIMKQDSVYQYIIILLLLVTSCFIYWSINSNTDSQYNDQVQRVLKEKAVKVQKAEVHPFTIDVHKIKKRYQKYSTSSFIPKSQILDIYPYYDEKGYFGRYILITDDLGGADLDEIVGNMVVFNNEKPWLYDNTTDHFVQIIAASKHLNLFKDINVGDSVSTLLKTWGDPWLQNGECLHYQKEEYICTFYIIGSIISCYRIGVYNNPTIETLSIH